MSSLIFKLLWFILNIIVDFVEIINAVVVFVKWKYILYFGKNYKNELKYIFSHKTTLKKIPIHIVIILSEHNKPSFNTLSNLIYWSLAAGVNYISFYDYQDDGREFYLQLYKYMSKIRHLKNEIDWRFEFDYKHSQEQNGTRNKLHINLIQPKHGKSEVISLTQQFGLAVKTNRLKTKEITINLVDNKLKESLGFMPDPEVAICFDQQTCGTYGLLPWQIRLTEFFSLGNQSYFTVNKFVDIMYKYSKCEQRFGK